VSTTEIVNVEQPTENCSIAQLIMSDGPWNLKTCVWMYRPTPNQIDDNNGNSGVPSRRSFMDYFYYDYDDTNSNANTNSNQNVVTNNIYIQKKLRQIESPDDGVTMIYCPTCMNCLDCRICPQCNIIPTPPHPE
jgi:hypothetical protein